MKKLSSIIKKAGKPRFNSAVILAAGSGSRFSEDTAKQFFILDGKPVFLRSVEAFEKCEYISEIVIVTRVADVVGIKNIISDAGIKKVTSIVAGGETRQKSAKIGFDKVNPECDFVAIHDAARCLVTPEMIIKAFDSAYINGASACASRAVDTIKKCDSLGNIKETIDRENVWNVQTPQVFMADMYRAAAYTAEKEHFTATDDCQLCEKIGFRVNLVNCGNTNMKITSPEDVIIAKAILDSRKNMKEGELV